MNGSHVHGYTCTVNHSYQVLSCSLQVIVKMSVPNFGVAEGANSNNTGERVPADHPDSHRL